MRTLHAPLVRRLLRFSLTMLLLAAPGLLAPCAWATGTTTPVFSTTFESGLPAEFSAPGSVLAGVQGWAGLGPAGHAFSGSFLRYTSVPIYPTTLTLANLPEHDSVNLDFLLAVIDSWDGTELMQVSVDGTLLFSHWFQLASGDSSDYIAPAGGLLSRGTDLGFTAGGWYTHDRAYDFSVEPLFHSIPHTASTLTVTWGLGAISGPAADQWQGGDDESWAIDEVRVSVNSSTTDVAPGGTRSLALAGAFPNPAPHGAMTLRFSLPSAEPATLDVTDVQGRRVFAREVGSLGSGPHQVEVGRGIHLAPGVYALRLEQRGNVRSSRVIVLR